MALENRLEIKLSQKLVLTPQLQMAIKLLQMPQLELSQTLTQEIIENPFLEESSDTISEDELSYEEKNDLDIFDGDKDDTEVPLDGFNTPSSFTVDDYFEERGADGRDLGYFTSGNVTQPSFEYFLSTAPDLYEHLLWQLRLCREDDDVRKAAEITIGNIDDNGYLTITTEEISQLSGYSKDVAEKALHLIQSFDPPGIGARDIKECLLLQIRPLELTGSVVEKIILNHLDLISRKKFQQVAKELNTSIEDIIGAVKIIEGLDPKPARNFSSVKANYITPDVFIIKTDDGYQIILNDEGLPKLRINNYYRRLLTNRNLLPKEERQFLDEKLRSAEWLIKSLDQRNKTIYRVTDSILNIQRDFFDTGIQRLKPLNLKDIATELGLHESTISRVTSNKFLSCPHGIFSFKFFFSNAIPSDSGELSSTSVKDMIRKITSEENPAAPLSDMKIVEILKNQNITIARRTIAKYREELKIPPQSQRKKQ